MDEEIKYSTKFQRYLMIHHYGANKVKGREVEITSPKVKIDEGGGREGERGGKGRRCPKD